MSRIKITREPGRAYRRLFQTVGGIGKNGSKAVYAMVCAPIFVAAAYVYLFGVNVVIGDQWEMVTTFSRLANDNLSAANLWMTHNEHRFFFPRMVMLILGTASGWNHIVEMYFILICLASVLATLAVAFVGGFGSGRLAFFVPVAFLVFSLNQWTNLLWGYQITFALTLAAAVCALFLLNEALQTMNGRGVKTSLYLVGAVLAAVVAAGSSIQGLLVFPAGVVQFLVFSRSRIRWGSAAVWGVSGIFVWTFYFWNYNPRNDTPSSLSGMISDPLSTVGYFLTIVGGSLFSQPRLLLAAGMILLAILAFAMVLVWRSERRSSYAFWLSLGSFSIFTLMAVTAGRSGIGIESALGSRYTTFSIIGVVSLYVITLKTLLEKQSWQRHAMFGTLALMVFMSLPLSFWSGIRAGISDKAAKEEAANVLLDYRNQNDDILQNTLSNPPESIRKRAVILEKMQYSSFAARKEP